MADDKLREISGEISGRHLRSFLNKYNDLAYEI
jgi:hypothetical protein